ncbi:SpoIIAA family protein [Spirosoma radiotolerans]|uniref:STAS/SEC14 domain-containing protein n=1 Tax=Spirosoma radiotolerans TaxID=1379870 RepID=A0A0E3V5D2_9BACT|nr:STAS/SEC14 domain-containing protein [Spirosoma radiotolerans]AKD54052.1 hypothetical protein SD10_03165 [Spirosoma radiotolerans]
MIKPIEFQADNIIGFQMTGKITEADIKQWSSVLDQQSNRHDKLRVYIEYNDVDAVSLKAVLADLKFDLTHLGDFEKAALVADQSWTTVPASLANLIPNLQAKQFSMDQKDEAKQWIAS